MHFDVTSVRLNHHVVGDDDSEFAGANYRTIGFSIKPQDFDYLEFGTRDADGKFTANAVLSSTSHNILYGDEKLAEVIASLTIRCRRDGEEIGNHCRVSYSDSIKSLSCLMTLPFDDFVDLEKKICLGLKLSSIHLEFDVGLDEIVNFGWEPDGSHTEWDYSKGKKIPLRSVDFYFGGLSSKDETESQVDREILDVNEHDVILSQINTNISNLIESNSKIQDRLYNAIICIATLMACFAIYILTLK